MLRTLERSSAVQRVEFRFRQDRTQLCGELIPRGQFLRGEVRIGVRYRQMRGDAFDCEAVDRRDFLRCLDRAVLPHADASHARVDAEVDARG